MSSTWMQLCEMLCPGDGSLYEEVRQADASPREYLMRFRQALLGRGIEKARLVNPWLALVDGLARRERLEEFDWRLRAEELADGLENLRLARQQTVALSRLRSSEQAGVALLRVAAEELEAWRLGLLVFDIDSDCFPLAIVRFSDIERIRQLAGALRRRVQIFQASA